MITSFAAFLSLSVILIVTPGPDMALTMKNALWGGRRYGFYTALGVISGLFVWTVAASVGLATLLLASEPAFMAVKFVGAAYLIFLGGQALYSALRSSSLKSTKSEPSSPPAPSTVVAYRQGLISNLGNPKIAVTFTSLLPQFIPAGEASFQPLLLLGTIFCLMTLIWLTVYVAIIAKAGDVLRRSGVRRALDALVGTALIALGFRLAAADR